MKYRKKPVVIEAITFEEFVEYGKNNGANIVSNYFKVGRVFIPLE